jgi:hypothetical protein
MARLKIKTSCINRFGVYSALKPYSYYKRASTSQTFNITVRLRNKRALSSYELYQENIDSIVVKYKNKPRIKSFVSGTRLKVNLE